MPWKLVEFIWRRKHNSNLWEAFITALKEVSFGDLSSDDSNNSNNNNNVTESHTVNATDGPIPQFTQVVLIEGKYNKHIFLIKEKKTLY